MNNLDKIIEEVQKLNYKIESISVIKSGKEAVVYKALLDNNFVAMKLYKIPEERNFKNVGDYLLGKHYKTSSHKRAIDKNNKFAKKLKHENWVKREFSILQKLYENGASIPKPILQTADAIFMELLGDKDFIAPRFCDIDLTKNEAQKAFDIVIKNIKLFWDLGIVHSDLSPYNILWWKDKPYTIDFPQSVDIRTQDISHELLKRDLENIIKFFQKYIEIDEQEVFAMFKEELTA